MADLVVFLRSSGLSQDVLENFVVPYFVSIGVKTVDDFEFIKEEDLLGINEISLVDQRKLLKFIERGCNDSIVNPVDTISDDFDCTISVRYVVYNVDDPAEGRVKCNQFTLLDFVQNIHNALTVPTGHVIELYSQEGYPLHVNDITNQVKLHKWGLKDDSLLFALIRREKQPGGQRFATLPKLDHEIGEETFNIETPYHGKFCVNAYMDSDSPEDIAQKIYSLTNIPVPYMSLFVRKGYNQERLDAFTELQDNNIIRVVLRDPQEMFQQQGKQYGKYSYNSVVTQTDLGMSKFFSILKFLCCAEPMNPKFDIEKLLSYLLDLTGFPPLVYSMRVLHLQSYLSIPGWVALVEGCYCLFKRIINCFANVPDHQIFEYCDYIWSFLIEQSQNVADSSDIECEKISLICPLSGTRIIEPVYLGGEMIGPFDKDNILAKIESGESFLNFGLDPFHAVTESDLEPDVETARLLICFPWEHNRHVYRWHKTWQQFKVCKKLDFSKDWLDLPKFLCNLFIINPSGLFAGIECLTYLDNGRLVYFLGASKGDDEHRRIYDPICDQHDYQRLIKKDLLDHYGRSNLEVEVTNDLSDVVPNIYNAETIAQCKQERISAIVRPNDTIQWEPDEAIVVILDYSRSMSSTIYPEIGKMRRIDAAKELFNAFVTRTQAYRLHHCFGLTLFSSHVYVKQELTKNKEEFEMSLHGLEPQRGTSLTDAIVSAVSQLQRYSSCTRRIICLTDGENTSCAYTYQEALNIARGANVIIDTVLLTGRSGNAEQKSISHATGGVCVLPHSMVEALRYFEMDTMLSVKERSNLGFPYSYFVQDYRQFSYETESSFKSKTIQEISKMSTTSASRFLSSSKSSHCHRRILKELRDIIQNPHPDFKVFPNFESCDSWKVLMKGPTESAYEGGVFVLGVKFPKKYPAIPPQIRFLTPIYHCNVSQSSGRICHAVLSNGYTPATSMKEVLSYIYGLLMCPDTDTPLDSTLVDEYGYLRHRESNPNKPLSHTEYFEEADSYFSKARRYVWKHANIPFEEMEREFDELIY